MKMQIEYRILSGLHKANLMPEATRDVPEDNLRNKNKRKTYTFCYKKLSGCTISKKEVVLAKTVPLSEQLVAYTKRRHKIDKADMQVIAHRLSQVLQKTR